MGNNIIFCSDPYVQSAEEYFNINLKNKITTVNNLNNLIDQAIRDFVIKSFNKIDFKII